MDLPQESKITVKPPSITEGAGAPKIINAEQTRKLKIILTIMGLKYFIVLYLMNL